MTIQHEILRMFRKKETLPVCLLSWERYKADKQDHLCVRVEGLWHRFKPPIPKKDIEQYKYFSHTYSPEAIEYYELINCGR